MTTPRAYQAWDYPVQVSTIQTHDPAYLLRYSYADKADIVDELLLDDAELIRTMKLMQNLFGSRVRFHSVTKIEEARP